MSTVEVQTDVSAMRDAKLRGLDPNSPTWHLEYRILTLETELHRLSQGAKALYIENEQLRARVKGKPVTTTLNRYVYDVRRYI
jgi:hypothetical protein